MRTPVVLLVIGACILVVGSVPVRAQSNTAGGGGATHGVAANRRVIDLNGTWEVAEGTMDAIPKQYGHKVPVPGLVDMAEPAFEEVGRKSGRPSGIAGGSPWRGKFPRLRS
jgi:hypothetical protein